jgi:3-oxoacyl-[acyl-carrier-protein] synthase II
MVRTREIVITGIGIISPIGIGNEPFWGSLCAGRSGVRRLASFKGSDLPTPLGAEVADFEPQEFVRPRKALKVMSRDIQLAFAAAELATSQAGIKPGNIDPERLGIVFGADLIACELNEMINAYRACIVEGKFEFPRWGQQALAELYPLWMLKYLPNMPACHIGIAHDARGPNNSLTLAEVSSLSAITEAVRVIQRGQADAMIAGGTSSRNHPTIWVRRGAYQLSQRVEAPEAACRPFDADRDGMVHGEGAAAFLLEAREHAEARGATILARILGFAHAFEPRRPGRPLQGAAMRAAIRQALRDAQLPSSAVGHVNADGLSTTLDDQLEAQAIHETLGDVPTIAPKSFFGNLSAGAGAVELAASLLAFQKGCLPPTLNYCRPDPQCPVNVVHGQPAPLGSPVALKLNHSRVGQSVAILFAADGDTVSTGSTSPAG